jgi:chromosome segregation protein
VDRLELPVLGSEGLTRRQLADVSQLEGRLQLAVAGGAPPEDEIEVPDDVESLLELAGVDDDNAGWLSRVLPPAYRCRDGGSAKRLADRHPGAIFVGPDSVIWRGRIQEPPTAGSKVLGALALRDERRRLSEEIEQLEQREQAAAAAHRDSEAGLLALEESVADLDGKLLTAEHERARAAAVEQSLGSELSRLRAELEGVVAEIERTGKQETALVDRRAKLEKEVTALEERTAELEQAVDDAAAELDARREDVSDAVRRLDRWQAEARLAGERAEAARGELQRLTADRNQLDERIAALEQEAEQLSAELEETEQEVVRSRTRLAEEQGLLSSARDGERRLSDRVEKASARVERLDREVRERREVHDRTRESLHEIEVELTRIDSEWERLREQAAAELDTTPEQLAKLDPDEGASPEELRAAIDDLRSKIERLGPVNLLALREVDELSERSTFLAGQRKDLVEALRKLDDTIREIDAFCTERFVETLEQVNTVFHETFSSLFGGGSACLELVDPDDPLESGIDITAQPPGKKTQSVQLLSGGEKALAALALLISLFRIKPSPFCVLDEVDAPLDDANVERLVDLIHAMTDHTQFVLITHNRRTMQRAEVLYGVTMERPGVSKLVSVRLEE